MSKLKRSCWTCCLGVSMKDGRIQCQAGPVPAFPDSDYVCGQYRSGEAFHFYAAGEPPSPRFIATITGEERTLDYAAMLQEYAVYALDPRRSDEQQIRVHLLLRNLRAMGVEPPFMPELRQLSPVTVPNSWRPCRLCGSLCFRRTGPCPTCEGKGGHELITRVDGTQYLSAAPKPADWMPPSLVGARKLDDSETVCPSCSAQKMEPVCRLCNGDGKMVVVEIGGQGYFDERISWAVPFSWKSRARPVSPEPPAPAFDSRAHVRQNSTVAPGSWQPCRCNGSGVWKGAPCEPCEGLGGSEERMMLDDEGQPTGLSIRIAARARPETAPPAAPAPSPETAPPAAPAPSPEVPTDKRRVSIVVDVEVDPDQRNNWMNLVEIIEDNGAELVLSWMRGFGVLHIGKIQCQVGPVPAGKAST